MEKPNVALFGMGTIGSVEAADWKRVANLRYVVDRNPAKKEAAEKLGAEFVCKDFKYGYELLSSSLSADLPNMGFHQASWKEDYGNKLAEILNYPNPEGWGF